MGVNLIRDAIELAICVSADSGVPVLLLANPGLAKSTIVSNWAARNGYHLETLIGSRFTQEEILGFQARVEDKITGEARLELLEPHWYRGVIQKKKQNTPTLLFLDELSTVQENVQGAMLQLVFDRTIGHGKKLPDSTIVVSAANYKQNIPFIFNIMAPILNRFCIVNLRYKSNSDFLDEFLQDESSRSDGVITYKNVKIDDETKKRLREGLKTMWADIFDSFKGESGQEALDINNQMYNNIYENDTMYVYNFITGRTIYYLYRITLSFLSKGLSLSSYGPLMLNMVFGLAGLGTNSLSGIRQNAYLKKLETLWTKMYSAFETGTAGGAPAMPPPAKLDFDGKTVSQAVNEWMLYRETSVFQDGADESLAALISHISGIYGAESDKIEDTRRRIEDDVPALLRFTDDMQKIDYLAGALPPPSVASLSAAALHKIRAAYASLTESALKSALNSALKKTL
jgi:hypothetical protein